MATSDQADTVALSTTIGAAKHSWRSLQSQQRLWGWVFISPWIIGFAIFTAAPIIFSLLFTFTDFNLSHPENIQFIGLQNWQRLFTDSDNLQALSVTLRFAAMAIPAGLIVPIIMAAFLNTAKLKGRRIWTTLLYMPYIVPAVSSAFVWRAFLNGDTGWLNRLLRLVGVTDPPNWVFNESWVLVGFLMVTLWTYGNAMLITLAGMQGVPTELYEAAQVDGANIWRRFRTITLPMISPVIFYNLVLSVIALMQFFTIPYVMSGSTSQNATPGDPNKSALFMNLYLYQTAFKYFNMGYGAAQAWIIFLLGLLVTGILFATAPLWVYYSSGD